LIKYPTCSLCPYSTICTGKRGGPRGDLYIQINVVNDPRFRREGNDIYTTEEISYTEAILGTTVKVDTVDGPTEVKMPAGTQPEQKLRLKGKGVPKLNSHARGDAYITVKVKIPTNVSGKERELVEKLAEIVDEKKANSNTSTDAGSIFSGVGGS
jgi:molecular chaperone DnaJ